jgi:hypothetical protein
MNRAMALSRVVALATTASPRTATDMHSNMDPREATSTTSTTDRRRVRIEHMTPDISLAHREVLLRRGTDSLHLSERRRRRADSHIRETRGRMDTPNRGTETLATNVA